MENINYLQQDNNKLLTIKQRILNMFKVTWCEELTHLKRLWCLERLRVGGEGDDREWDGWMASLTQWHGFGWTLGVGDGQGGLACCSSWGRRESDTTERLNCNWNMCLYVYMGLDACNRKEERLKIYLLITKFFFF